MDDATRARIDELVVAARDAMDRAYAPYSRFLVGAAVLANDRIFIGQNFENASLSMSICAERNAVGRMIDAGERTIDAIAVVTVADRPTAPCGACRQVLWEFGPSSLVICETTSGARDVYALEDLLPAAFGPDDLLDR